MGFEMKFKTLHRVFWPTERDCFNKANNKVMREHRRVFVQQNLELIVDVLEPFGFNENTVRNNSRDAKRQNSGWCVELLET